MSTVLIPVPPQAEPAAAGDASVKPPLPAPPCGGSPPIQPAAPTGWVPPVLSAAIVPPPIAAPAASPLSAARVQELAAANRSARRFLPAGKIAAFNGWTFAVLAAMSLLGAAISPLLGGWDVKGLLAGLGMAALAWNEWRGRRLLRRLNLRGPRVLGWNQLAVLGLVIVYAGWSIAVAFIGPGPYDQTVRAYPELSRTFGSLDRLHRLLTLAVYGSLIAGSLVFQGLNAWYYFSRSRHLREHLDKTPPWIADLQRSGMVG